jgi:hypothetical protein
MTVDRDTRPTQAEVEAKAAEMFGERWKSDFHDMQRVVDREIAEHLDLARAAVIRERSS